MLPLTTLYLGNELDGPILFPLSDSINTLFLGPNKLLKWLEETLGLDGFSQKNDYLRVELYRQALLQYLEANPPSSLDPLNPTALLLLPHCSTTEINFA